MMKKEKMVKSIIGLSAEITVFIIGIIAAVIISGLFIIGYISVSDEPEVWYCNVALIIALIVDIYPIVRKYYQIVDLLYDEEDS